MATIFSREHLKRILANLIRDARARDVSSIADISISFSISTSISFSPVNILVDSGRVVHTTTTIVRLTFHLATGTVDQEESWTVYELANDLNSPPFKRNTEYRRTPNVCLTDCDSSPRLFASVIEDGDAAPSDLVSAVADWCIERAKKAIADKAESE